MDGHRFFAGVYRNAREKGKAAGGRPRGRGLPLDLVETVERQFAAVLEDDGAGGVALEFEAVGGFGVGSAVLDLQRPTGVAARTAADVLQLDAVGPAGAAVEGIAAVAVAEDEQVVAVVAPGLVVALAAVQSIVASAAVKRVVAFAAGEGVVAFVTVQESSPAPPVSVSAPLPPARVWPVSETTLPNVALRVGASATPSTLTSMLVEVVVVPSETS